MNGTCSRGWTPPRPSCAPSSTACPFATPLTPAGPRAVRAASCRCRRTCRRRSRRAARCPPRRASATSWPRSGAARASCKELAAAHRHHQPGRHRLDQSRPLGEPARRVRPAHPQRRVPRRQARQRPALGHDARRASTSSWASPSRTCSCCWAPPGSPPALTARGCCRSAPSTTRSSIAASMR